MEGKFKMTQRKKKTQKMRMIFIATVILTGPFFQTAAVAEKIIAPNTEDVSAETVTGKISEIQANEISVEKLGKEELVGNEEELVGNEEELVGNEEGLDASINVRAVSVNVSTGNEFIVAFNDANVTQINLINDIVLTSFGTLQRLTRNLTINGNNFNLYTENKSIALNSNISFRMNNLNLTTNLPSNDTLLDVYGENVEIILNGVNYSNRVIAFANIVEGLSTSYSIIIEGGTNTLRKTEPTADFQSAPAMFNNVTSVEVLNNSVLNVFDGSLLFAWRDMADTSLYVESGSTLSLSSTVKENTVPPLRYLDTLDIYGKANVVATGSRMGIVENIHVRNTGEFELINHSDLSAIDGSTSSMNFENGSKFDIINTTGQPIVSNNNIGLSIKTESLAFWDLGLQDQEFASTVFKDISVNLAGVNASEIISTDNERFSRLYDSNGLASYSRLSSRDVAEIERVVTINHINEAGINISDSEVMHGFLGDNYQTVKKNIPGYVLTTQPYNEQGQFTREDIVVNYVYVKALIPTTISPLTTSSQLVTGTGEPNGELTILNGATVIARGRVGNDGIYNVTIPQQSAGTTITARVEHNGLASEAFTVVTQALPNLDRPIVPDEPINSILPPVLEISTGIENGNHFPKTNEKQDNSYLILGIILLATTGLMYKLDKRRY